MNIRIVIPLLLIVYVPGCSTSRSPGQKEQATQNWNAARASVLAGLANDQYKNGDFAKSRQTLDEAMKLTPESEPLHVLSAKLAIEQGEPEFADRELESARKLAPNDPEPCYLSGVIYQRWQKYPAACDFYRWAAQKAPGELAYLLAQAEMLVAMDRAPEALHLLQNQVAYFEHSATIRDAVGQLLAQAGRYKEAVAMFRQARMLSEEDESICEGLAMALHSAGDDKEASQILARLTQNEPYSKRADLFLVLGACQVQSGPAQDARRSFETATQLDPNSAPAWQGLGRTALECGDLRRADLALRKALSVDATGSETHLLAGYLRLRQGRLTDALAAFEKASDLDGRDTVSLCMVGYVYAKMGQREKAGEYYNRALRIKPGDELATQLIAGAT